MPDILLRPRAEVIVFRAGKVLADLTPGYVCFPGGGMDGRESAVEAATREYLEEADRILAGVTIAHCPTSQMWSEAYKAKKKKWTGKSTVGGYTHWLTGRTSVNPFHADPKERHADYQKGFDWYSPEDLLKKLSLHGNGEWSEDVAVRSAILRSHIAAHKTAMFPTLCALKTQDTIRA